MKYKVIKSFYVTHSNLLHVGDVVDVVESYEQLIKRKRCWLRLNNKNTIGYDSIRTLEFVYKGYLKRIDEEEEIL